MERELETERNKMDILKNTINQFLETENQLKPYKDLDEANPNRFYTNASETLNILTYLGYDELGQENIDALLRGFNAGPGRTGVWKNPEIDMTDTRVRQEQLKFLRDFTPILKEKFG